MVAPDFFLLFFLKDSEGSWELFTSNQNNTKEDKVERNFQPLDLHATKGRRWELKYEKKNNYIATCTYDADSSTLRLQGKD